MKTKGITFFKYKLLGAAAMVFLAFVLLEALLQYNGFKPGVLSNRFMPIPEVVYSPRFVSDSVFGAPAFNTECPSCLPPGFVLNKQGYRSPINFDSVAIDAIKKQNKKVILVLGDSYTEGCCAEPIDSSFMDILFHSTQKYVTLNAGVGGTGPIHYEKILYKLFAAVKPDAVVVNFYIGNDIQWLKETVMPNIPHTYPIENYNWLSSTVPVYYQKWYGSTYFKDYKEAYNFYVNNVTLWGTNAGLSAKIIRKSVLASWIVLGAKNAYYLVPWVVTNFNMSQGPLETRKTLERMQAFCNRNETPFLLAMIPSAEGPWDNKKVEKSLADVCKTLPCSFPNLSTFSATDFDGSSSANHYNNTGHRKHAAYLKQTLDSLVTTLR